MATTICSKSPIQNANDRVFKCLNGKFSTRKIKCGFLWLSTRKKGIKNCFVTLMRIGLLVFKYSQITVMRNRITRWKPKKNPHRKTSAEVVTLEHFFGCINFRVFCETAEGKRMADVGIIRVPQAHFSIIITD